MCGMSECLLFFAGLLEFQDLARGREQYEICRIFAATLQLVTYILIHIAHT